MLTVGVGLRVMGGIGAPRVSLSFGVGRRNRERPASSGKREYSYKSQGREYAPKRCAWINRKMSGFGIAACCFSVGPCLTDGTGQDCTKEKAALQASYRSPRQEV